jgi:aspartate-semialdehyde dehydrogenase
MSYNIAVVGATGKVGAEILKILDSEKFPVKNIYAVASSNSIGKQVSFGEEKVINVNAIENFDFSKVDIAFFSAGSSVSKEYAPIAVKAGAVVIDNTSYFRMYNDVPLVVPEVNSDAIKLFKNRGIIANPNCVAIPLAVALNPIHNVFELKKVVVSTYQSVSGAGKEAMDELYEQTRGIYVYKQVKPELFQRQIAFNLIPQIDVFDPSGFSGEETKIMSEFGKIVDKNINIVATAVRSPVFLGHSMSVHIECEEEASVSEIKKILSNSQGVVLTDDEDLNQYITPIEVAGKDEVFVSRVRKSPYSNKEFELWIVADNIRKGAALNAVQIAQILSKSFLS